MVAMSAKLARVARRELSFLIEQYDFRLVKEDEHHLRFESAELAAEIWFDPRGEISLSVRRLSGESERAYGKVEYVGHVGLLNREKVVRQLAKRLEGNTRALHADAAYFDLLAREQRQASIEYTAWAAGETDEQPPPGRYE